jgi:uncharacterized protein
MKNISAIKDQRFLMILADVKEQLLKLFGDKLQQLILYGSYARKTQDSESDIDIMILINESESGLHQYREKVVAITTELSLKYDTLITSTRTTCLRFNQYLDILPFYQNVFTEGIEFYGKKIA